MSLGHANYSAFVILVDAIALGLTVFHDFVTKAAYIHVTTSEIVGLILERTPGPIVRRVKIAI